MKSLSPKARVRTSRKLERKVAAELGGRVQPGSGSQWHAKDDVRADRFERLRVEHKYTQAGFYRFDARDFEVLKRSAHRHDETPLFVIEFLRPPQLTIALISVADLEGLEISGIRDTVTLHTLRYRFDQEALRAAWPVRQQFRFVEGPHLLCLPYRGGTTSLLETLRGR